MKSIVVICSLIVTLFIGGKLMIPKGSTLYTGAFSFVSMNEKTESFQIITHTTILPNTTVHFTDSEWNGTRFGVDESDLIWNSGKDTIYPETWIHFSNLDTHPKTSFGTLQHTMRISKKQDAIFAYQGSARLPDYFIAVIANDETAVGTLVNTRLSFTTNSDDSN